MPNQSVFSDAKGPTLHHVSLFVSDIDASIAFYTEGLGLTLREAFEDIVPISNSDEAIDITFGLPSVFLEGGDGRYIELHPAGPSEMSPPGFPMNHLALTVGEVDSAYQKALDAGGTKYHFDLPNGEWDGSPLNVVMSGKHAEAMRMAFLQGPSGELIELYQSSIN